MADSGAMAKATIPITNTPEANQLLVEDPLALLIGMLLDQQVAMETAFAGPEKLRTRLGGLDARSFADTDPELLETVFKASPAVHRFPGSMAGRVQALCRVLVDDWDSGMRVRGQVDALMGAVVAGDDAEVALDAVLRMDFCDLAKA